MQTQIRQLAQEAGNDVDISHFILDKFVREMPLLPNIVTRLLTIDRDSDNYFDTLTTLAELDPCFAIKIINMANSVYFKPDHEISRISHALSRIGANTISEVISNMSIMRVFMPTNDDQRYLWVHAIETALCSRFITRLLADARGLADEAYLAGLLHDVGRFVMLENTPGDMAKVDSTHWHTPKELVSAEQNLYGYNHAELGSKICTQIQLPDLLNQVIRRHHSNQLNKPGLTLEPQTRLLIQIVQISDLFSTIILRDPNINHWKHGQLCQQIEMRCLNMACSDLRLNPETLADQVRQLQIDTETRVRQLGIFARDNVFMPIRAGNAG